MPHFSDCCPGADTYICQVCGTIHCSNCEPSQWRPDLTGSQSAGNVCPECRKSNRKREDRVEAPLSLWEHCKQESGLTDPAAIRKYMNRYYGHN